MPQHPMTRPPLDLEAIPSDALLAELVRRDVLKEKRSERFRPTRVPCDCEHPTHAVIVGVDSSRTHVTTEVIPVIQHASPWKREATS